MGASWDQQREGQSPVPGEEQPQAPVGAGGQPGVKELSRKGPAGQGVDPEPALGSCSSTLGWACQDITEGLRR